MNRIEAYRVLVEEMERRAALLRKGLADTDPTAVEVDALGADGVLYSVKVSVERLSERAFRIAGSVHDNSSHGFSLLEEHLDFELDQIG